MRRDSFAGHEWDKPPLKTVAAHQFPIPEDAYALISNGAQGEGQIQQTALWGILGSWAKGGRAEVRESVGIQDDRRKGYHEVGGYGYCYQDT